MKLHFLYSSSPIDSPERVDALKSQFQIACDKCTWMDSQPSIEMADDRCSIEAKLVLELTQPGSSDATVDCAMQMIRVLATLSSEFRLSWNVGHQLDPQLGTIIDGDPSGDLLDEIRTAVTVARSLSEIIVDDEFVEPDSSFEHDDQNGGLGDQRSWSDAFETPDPFIRFPEW